MRARTEGRLWWRYLEQTLTFDEGEEFLQLDASPKDEDHGSGSRVVVIDW